MPVVCCRRLRFSFLKSQKIYISSAGEIISLATFIKTDYLETNDDGRTGGLITAFTVLNNK